VVRTDVAQFILLLGGGLLLTLLSIDRLGGWSQLYIKTQHLMHLHLPSNHPTIPWTALLGMNLLNLNYWGASQIILQRVLAAKNLRHAQVGLLVGGLLKYLMAAIIIVPGIALVGILGDPGLSDPDQTYPTLVKMLLPTGLSGLSHKSLHLDAITGYLLSQV
jgi:solute:Na+ symporter, SSS family